MAVLKHEGSIEILYRDYPMPAGSGFSDGYLARPDRVGSYPVVVLLTGLRGVTPAMKDLARRFARHGYSTLVPDLTRGDHPGDEAPLGDQVAAYDRTDDRRSIVDIEDAVSWAMNDSADWARNGKYALVGLDIGGRFAILHAAHHQHEVAALIVAYAPLAGDEGRSMHVADVLDKLPMAVLGLYGADDEYVPVAGVDEAQLLNGHGRWIRYEGVGHDFLDGDLDTYHSGAASDAHSRILATLAATLK